MNDPVSVEATYGLIKIKSVTIFCKTKEKKERRADCSSWVSDSIGHYAQIDVPICSVLGPCFWNMGSCNPAIKTIVGKDKRRIVCTSFTQQVPPMCIEAWETRICAGVNVSG